MSVLGDNIRAYRGNINLTQQELSDYLECDRVSLSYYETGERQPSIDILLKMSDIFGVELDDLLNESSDVLKENLSLAFRKEGMSSKNLNEIASFKKIIKNYIKMNRLATEYGL